MIPAFYALYYNSLQEIANKNGYALAIHGSMDRDLDLIAIPWVKNCINEKELIDLFSKECNVIIDNYVKKPFGRHGYTFTLYGDYYIDLSIMPKLRQFETIKVNKNQIQEYMKYIKKENE
jgi:hypothetical protein